MTRIEQVDLTRPPRCPEDQSPAHCDEWQPQVGGEYADGAHHDCDDDDDCDCDDDWQPITESAPTYISIRNPPGRSRVGPGAPTLADAPTCPRCKRPGLALESAGYSSEHGSGGLARCSECGYFTAIGTPGAPCEELTVSPALDLKGQIPADLDDRLAAASAALLSGDFQTAIEILTRKETP